MEELRDIAFALSVDRRGGEAQRKHAAQSSLDLSDRKRPQHILFALGDRVLVQDTFERPCGAQTPFWWEAVVSGCTAEQDYVRAAAL